MTLIVQSHVTNLTPGMERSTLTSAGRSAETNGDRMARGLPGRCVRGRFKHLIRPEQCAAFFLCEFIDCARDGGCSTGRLMAARYKEQLMASSYGKCRNEACPNSKKRVLLPALGLCAACYKADLAARKRGPASEEVAAMSAAMSTDGQGEHTGITEEHGENGVAAGQDMASPVSAQDVTCYDPAAEAAALDAVMGLDAPAPAAGQNHVAEPSKMVTDFTRPFSFGGFDFDPLQVAPPAGRPVVRLSKSGNFHVSTPATKTFDLLRFRYVRIIPDKTGTVLALIFSTENTDGGRSLAVEKKSPFALKASAGSISRTVPGVVGKPLELRPMGQDGVFVAVAVEEAGEVAA